MGSLDSDRCTCVDLASRRPGEIVTSYDPETLVRRWLRSAAILRLPVTDDIVIQSRILPFQHADPFDRIIGGTAHFGNMPLMTADRNLLGLGWLATITTRESSYER